MEPPSFTNSDSTACEENSLGNRYASIQRLGAGAYAEVTLCKDQRTGLLVAVKTLHSHIAADISCCERFKREASIASQLKHPNIVPVTDTGLTQNGNPYLVMDYVNGPTLRAMYEKKIPLTTDTKIKILLGIAYGLQHAHHFRMTHRDIKPENILIDDGLTPRITDFGVAKCWENDISLTMTGDTIGTPVYMSPEQFKGGDVDARTDIYTFGAVAFELLCGSIPFKASNYQDMALLHTTAPIPSLLNHNRELPIWLDEFIQLCLQKDPQHRYQNMDEVIYDLTRDRRPFWKRLFK